MTSLEVYTRHKYAFILAIILIGLVHDVRCVTYQISADPENVAIGQTLTITAKLTGPFNQGANTDLNIKLTQPGQQTNTIFQYRTVTGCIFLNQEPYISTGTVVTCDPANSRYVIRFPSVTAAHVGLYELQAPLENPARSADAGVTANVQLLVAPTSVTVTPAKRVVLEGQATNFVCTVDDQATIPVSFVWKRIVNGNRVNPPAAATTTMIPGGRGNRISWNSVSRQHAGQYECTASNQVGAKTSQPPTQLVVYYPATSVKLTTGTTTVSVGTSVTFTCTSSGGNPRPGLVIFDANSGKVWKESVQSGSTTLTYGPILTQKSTNGAKYGCKTKVTVGAGNVPVKESNTLTVDVQFSPNGIKAPARVTLDEGKSTTVRCETTSSSNPKTELTWTGPAVGQSPESTSLGAHKGVNTVQPVTLTGDRTRNGATYTCTATYLGQQIYTKSTKLNVNFAPKAIAFYDTPGTPILEKQERVLRCRAKTSKPPGTIIWRKNLNGNPSVIPAGPPTEVPGDFGGTVLETNITIQPSRHDNGAKYWCEVDYTYKNGTKVTRRAPSKVLEVHYRVDISITVSQNKDNIREGDPLNLTCETSGGNPQTIDKYKWRYNGNILVNATERSLSLNPIDYDEGGNYSCSATNKGGTSNKSVDIDVKFKPKLDPSVAHRLELAAGVGETRTFSLTILANPAPTTAKWTKADSSGDLPSERFIRSRNGQLYSLEVKNIIKKDFTTYKCTIENSVRSVNFLVTLKAEGPPDVPSDFKIVGRSSKSLTLQWISESSGATNQTFHLEQLSPQTEEPVVKITVSDEVEHEVKNLQPATEYTFRLKSTNDLGLSSSYTKISGVTKKNFPEDLRFEISRPSLKDNVTVSWAQDELKKDYGDATVTVAYKPIGSSSARKRRSNQDEDENDGGEKSVKFSAGRMELNVTEQVEYDYDVTVTDGEKIVLRRDGLRVQKNPGQPPDITGAVAGVVVCFIIILILVIVLVVLLHRKGIVGGHAKKEAPVPTDQVEGTTNPGYLGSIDSEVPQVHVSTPAISPYVVFPTQMRPKRTSMVDKVKQRLSTVSTKSDEKASHYAEARVGLAAESNYAEASFSEKPAPSNGAPAAKTKRGFNFFKGKGKKGQGSPASNKAFADLNGGTPGESSTDEISPYGTTNAYRDDISPYGTTNAYHDDISPYGTTNAPVEEISPYGTTNMFQPRPGPSAGAAAPLYAEVNKKRPAAPLYAEVDKTKKNNPVPVYAQVNKSGGGPPEPLYAAVDKGKKAPPAPPMYASVDTSRKRRPVPQDDAVMYAEINQDLINGRPDPSNDTYANLGSMPGERPEPTYANLSDMPPQRPEQPTTHVGVDGIIYTELIKKPEPPPGKPKPKPKPKPEETIYAEIDPTKSKPQ